MKIKNKLWIIGITLLGTLGLFQENIKANEVANSPFPNVSVEDIQVSSGMGWRSLDDIQYHQGWDLPQAKGTPVLTIGAGKVVYAGFISGHGNIVIVYDEASDTATYYQHLSEIKVSKDTEVKVGQEVGTVGGTGESPDYDSFAPHLHIGMYKNAGEYVNNDYPLPPLPKDSKEAATTDYLDPAQLFGCDSHSSEWVNQLTNMYGTDTNRPDTIKDGTTTVTVGDAQNKS
ncbi:m24 m37 family peptidase [Ligilactobacillus hayakitensis DSM 18933 = JCM 14209]|uniref:M24 m37 family peptidase n=1 Tax=Ligilactobacillus hayakitensis DSM 18933 = JCM 14209 TaxID=1423755 RepID=A0A0R1WXC6_9LACO|nr:M23 family metallopeptidase [Ligilactobacillus hayakitensis]KRM19539.1 m24 m37 family peptidase [Ligilactobacillus hayakitensis DSM 18933 = JCM 14209]